MKYLVYMRGSTDKQDLTAQEEMCMEMVPDGATYMTFSDPDTSSSVSMHKRWGLQEMLANVQKNDCVIIYKLDRLSRDVIEMISIWREIKHFGCKILSPCDKNCDDEFYIGLMGIIAQKEKSDLKDRITNALATKKRNGERTGKLPYGYTVDPDKMLTRKQRDGSITSKPYLLVPNPEEYPTLLQMQSLQRQGIPYRKIAETLTQSGRRNREGTPFCHMTVYKILKRRDLTKSQEALLDTESLQMSH